MNLRREREDDVEINLTSLIDVVLLLLVFFMVSTTFVQRSEIEITLPEAADDVAEPQVKRIAVAVDAHGRFFVEDHPLTDARVATLKAALARAADGIDDPIIVIRADAEATHQSVVNVLDAARQLGYLHVTFATEVREEQP